MKAYLRLFVEAFRANVAAVTEYRVPFLVQLVGMMVNNAAFLVFWGVLLSQTGTLGGWGLQDVLWLWALGPASFGLAHVVFGNVNQLGRLIVQGDLDVYLLQPKDPLFHCLVSKTMVSAWGDLAYGLVLAPFLSLDPGTLLLFLGFTVTGALVFASSFALAQTLSFWLGSIEGLAGAVTEFLLTFTLYPESVFPAPMRWVFYTLIPAGFVAFLPLHILKTFDLLWLPVVLGAAVALAVLTWFVFQAGLKRYESGNSIGARI